MEKKIIRNIISQSYAPEDTSVYWNDGVGFREYKNGKWQYLHPVILSVDIPQSGPGTFAKNREIYNKIKNFMISNDYKNCPVVCNGQLGTAKMNKRSIEIVLYTIESINHYSVHEEGAGGPIGFAYIWEQDVYDF